MSGSLAINKRLAAAVRRTLEDDGFALVLAGSCDSSIGVLGGIEGVGSAGWCGLTLTGTITRPILR